MEVSLEQAIEYLSGLWSTMKVKNELTGGHVNDDELMILKCLEVVLTDVKINQFKR